MSDSGSAGYQLDSEGYPVGEEGDGAGTGRLGDPDPERFMDPRKFAKSGMVSSSQPIAHQGKAGWAFKLATREAVYLDGEIQWDVLARDLGAPRDEPGLTDVPAHGGLPEAAPDPSAVRAAAKKGARRTVQLGLRLQRAEADELERAAELFGMRRTALARMLVIRGAREIVGRAPDSSE